MRINYLNIVGLCIPAITIAIACWPSNVSGAELKASLADPAWDGKTVPENQVCSRFGGKGTTPAVKITGIPSGTQSIVVAFADETYAPMDNGGHGVLKFSVPSGVKEYTLPKVKAESDDLPSGVSVVTAHRGSGWSGTEGAYLPPCSGGKGNSYYADITAQDSDGKNLADTYVEMGLY